MKVLEFLLTVLLLLSPGFIFSYMVQVQQLNEGLVVGETEGVLSDLAGDTSIDRKRVRSNKNFASKETADNPISLVFHRTLK